MPYPRKGQTKEGYIAEFVKSDEARHDFPDEKQRLAVAYSLWEKRNGRLNSSSEVWPKEYECNFIEPGVVHYQDLGACKKCGLAGSCGEGQCEPTGETVLVDNNALAKMAKSFIGKSVLDKQHADVDAGTIARGEADGIVTRVWLDAESGWWRCRFIVWDPETQRHCESPAYSVSCAYNPTDVDSSGGAYHNLDFQQKILDGEYTHLAVVTNPRYEGARIQLVNSKDGKGGLKMNWKFWDKNAARRNASSLDPAKTLVTLDGKKISLQALFNAAEEPAPKPKDELGDDTVLEHDGKEMTLGELKAKARANMKNAEDDLKCPACDGSGKKAAENAGGDEGEPSGHRGDPEPEARVNEDTSPVKDPLPDMRNPKANGAENPDEAEAAAKAAEKAAADKKALELEQSRKNEAAEAEKAKSEEAEERRNAAEAKRVAARRSFEALKNAASERTGPAVGASIVSQDERLARGASKYGSKKGSVPA